MRRAIPSARLTGTGSRRAAAILAERPLNVRRARTDCSATAAVARVRAGYCLVASLVVARPAGHDELRVAASDLGQEPRRALAAQRRRLTPTVGDDHDTAGSLLEVKAASAHAAAARPPAGPAAW